MNNQILSKLVEPLSWGEQEICFITDERLTLCVSYRNGKKQSLDWSGQCLCRLFSSTWVTSTNSATSPSNLTLCSNPAADSLATDCLTSTGDDWELWCRCRSGNRNKNMRKLGTRIRRVRLTRDNGNGSEMTTFSSVPKFPSVDSVRIQSNKMS